MATATRQGTTQLPHHGNRATAMTTPLHAALRRLQKITVTTRHLVTQKMQEPEVHHHHHRLLGMNHGRAITLLQLSRTDLVTPLVAIPLPRVTMTAMTAVLLLATVMPLIHLLGLVHRPRMVPRKLEGVMNLLVPNHATMLLLLVSTAGDPHRHLDTATIPLVVQIQASGAALKAPLPGVHRGLTMLTLQVLRTMLLLRLLPFPLQALVLAVTILPVAANLYTGGLDWTYGTYL